MGQSPPLGAEAWERQLVLELWKAFVERGVWLGVKKEWHVHCSTVVWGKIGNSLTDQQEGTR